MVDNTPRLTGRFDSWDYCRGDFDVTNSMDDMKKIFIYTVTWCLSYLVQDPCPDSKRKDEFGRYTSGITCAAYHGHIETDCEGLSKMFVSRDSAFVFYNKAMYEQSKRNLWSGGLVNVKIDSTEVK